MVLSPELAEAPIRRPTAYACLGFPELSGQSSADFQVPG